MPAVDPEESAGAAALTQPVVVPLVIMILQIVDVVMDTDGADKTTKFDKFKNFSGDAQDQEKCHEPNFCLFANKPLSLFFNFVVYSLVNKS